MSAYQPTSRRPIAGAFRRTADGAVAACVRWGVHPDVISWGSLVAAAGAGLSFWQAGRLPWLLVAAAALCFLRLWFNMLDGMVALASGKASRHGEVLNEVPDRFSDVMIFVGAAHSGLCHPLGGYWAAIFALLVAYVGTFAQTVGAGRLFTGLMSKPWRMVAVSVGALVTLVLLQWPGAPTRFFRLTVLDWTHVLIVVGGVQTIVLRLAQTMRALRQNRSGGNRQEDPPGEA